MGKRFVTRSRQAWEVLLEPDTESEEARASASRWLVERLGAYVQSTPDAPITLAVPDRFLAILGDVPETPASSLRDGPKAARRGERPGH